MAAPRLSIAEALERWAQASRAYAARAEAQRAAVAKRFPLEAWPTMRVEDYALGVGDPDTFCRWMEFKTPDCGGIGGGSAKKHLIFRRASGEWYFQKKYASLDEAWTAVRAGFVRAFELAADDKVIDIEGVEPLAQALSLSGKAVYTYFPDQTLPIYGHQPQEHFWRLLGGTGDIRSGAPGARQLLDLARTRPEFSGWSPTDISQFLYFWADPRDTRRIVKIAPGHDAEFWPECRDGGYICVGWDKVGDLREFETKDEFKARFHDEYAPDNTTEAKISAKANEVWRLRELEPGDIVIANKGTSHVLAVGTVVDPGYEWREDRASYRHTVRIEWNEKYAGDIAQIKSWGLVTVADVPNTVYQRILHGGASHGVDPVEHIGVPVAAVDPVFADIEDALERKGQVILYGPPGTGKTYVANRFSVWWLRRRAKAGDADQVLATKEAFAKAEHELSTSHLRRRVWWVVANPAEWSWDQLFKDGRVDYRYGKFKKNYASLSPGDLVVGYQANPDKRIMALAQVAAGLHDVDGTLRITLEPIARIANGMSYEELTKDPVLAVSEPIRARNQGTLFALSEAEATYVLSVLSERNPDLPALDADEEEVGFLTRITFHPSYTYEDFVEGYKPVESGDGQLILRLQDGVFKRICRAAKSRPNEAFLLLIDEINRANIPKVFGELITLLERDKRGMSVILPQSQEAFNVPPNVLMVGTMNTADRSIKLLDAALRRRFAFIEFMPDSGVLAGGSVDGLALDVFLEALNRRIADHEGREKQIGHSFLLGGDGQPVGDADEFSRRFRQDILPLLQEYAYEDYGELAEYVGAGIVDAKDQRIRKDVVSDPAALVSALRETFMPKDNHEAAEPA